MSGLSLRAVTCNTSVVVEYASLSMVLWVKLPVVDRIQRLPQSNKFATGVENKATGDLKHNDSPDNCNSFSARMILILY